MAINGTPVNIKTRQEMFEYWVICQSDRQVMQKFDVCATTVKKYREKDDWDGQLKARQEDVRKAADYDYEVETAAQLRVLRKARLLIESDIDKKEPGINRKISDLSKLTTSEQLISGKPTDRNETNLIGRIEFVFIGEDGDDDESKPKDKDKNSL